MPLRRLGALADSPDRAYDRTIEHASIGRTLLRDTEVSRVLKPRGRRVAVTIVLLACAGAAAVPAQASDAGAHSSAALHFGGRTSQCPPSAGRCAQVGFLVAKNMRKVMRFAIEYAATCQSDPSNPILDGVGTTTLPLSASGRSYGFSAEGTYDLDPDSAGNSRHAQVSFSAKVGLHGRAKGTFEAMITVVNAAGATVDTCSTGATPVTWTARLIRG
jgi:hypothetical protein